MTQIDAGAVTESTALETFIPVCEPVLGEREREYVLDCLDGNWISSLGKYIPRFERMFSSFCGAGNGVACSSGTAALHLALESLDIGPGDEVIIPAFSLIVSANVVCWTGATPVLVDATRDTWCIDPERIEAKITPKTKAIMVVHMYGHPADMGPIMAIARRHGLKVIEDCAQAHGAAYMGKRVGSIGHVGAFSFYGNKILTTGEGGMLVTDDAEVAERAAYLRNQAFEEERFVHRAVGFNYRMTNLQAAIGVAQCERIDSIIERKLDIARRYRELLTGCEGLVLPAQQDKVVNVHWMFGVLVQPSFSHGAAIVRDRLAKAGVDTRSFFVPLNRQPVYSGSNPRFPNLSGRFPVSEELSIRGLYLPSGLNLTPEKQAYVVEQLRAARD
jgi:perosamine synthetase